MINLAIMSDSQLYCDAIDALLEQSSSISVAGSAKNTAEILSVFETSHIDIILLDMRLQTSREILTFIAKAHTSVKIIIMSDSFEKYTSLADTYTNICSHLANHATIEELIDAIVAVYKSKLYYSGSATQDTQDTGCTAQNEYGAITGAESAIFYKLTRREMQITRLLLQGQSNKIISQKLIIKLSTVKNHVHNILAKLGVESRMHIAELFNAKEVTRTAQHPPYEYQPCMGFYTHLLVSRKDSNIRS